MKQISIQKLLEWAFTYELGKVGATSAGFSAAWQRTHQLAELGTVVDRSPNVYGAIPGFLDEGEPHPDAVMVGDAVRGLAARRFDIPEGWQPFPEFDDPYGLIAQDVESVVSEIRLHPGRLSGAYMAGLVISAAIMGKGPDWQVEKPELQIVSTNGTARWFVRKKGRDAFGQVYWFEVNGFDKKRRRPMRGAYVKYELVAPLRGDILSRLDWLIWQDALVSLGKTLSGRLSHHAILPVSKGLWPWPASCHAAPISQPLENIAN